MSEYIVWDMSQLIKLPDTVSFEEAVLTDPIGFSLHGITRANMQLGDNVLIIGGTVPGLIPVSYTHLDVYKRQLPEYHCRLSSLFHQEQQLQ